MRRSGYQAASPGRGGSISKEDKPIPPFPRQQMFILALCRVAEPIAFMGIFPYIYFMIKDFHITDDETQISFYAGMVTSAFTFAEFSTGVFWGRLSDRIGRKPVLLTGLAGTALSVLMFGFAPSLPVALLARALGGLLNGNMGVLQTTVAELVTAKEHEARAYTIMPMVWGIGSIIGPMIGGALARPCQFYPDIFPPGSVWDRFPYLLPNLFSAAAVFCGLFIGILFLEETHSEQKKRRDRGLELGNRLLSIVSWSLPSRAVTKAAMDEEQPLLESEEQLPGYRTASSSPKLVSGGCPELQELDLARPVTASRKPPFKIFTKQAILNITSFGILAFHTMTFDSLFPVFLGTAEPENAGETSLPFKFVGGFGFDNHAIGIIMAVQGAYSLFANAFLFPCASRSLGNLRLFQLLATSYFLLYLVTPYIVLLPDSLRMIGIYAIIVVKCTFSTMAYPTNAILTKNSAPSLLYLGTIMGAHASTASLCRTLGPIVSGFLYSMGLETGYSGLAWWCSGAVALVGAAVALQLKESWGPMDEKIDDAEAELVLPPVAVDED